MSATSGFPNGLKAAPAPRFSGVEKAKVKAKPGQSKKKSSVKSDFTADLKAEEDYSDEDGEKLGNMDEEEEEEEEDVMGEEEEDESGHSAADRKQLKSGKSRELQRDQRGPSRQSHNQVDGGSGALALSGPESRRARHVEFERKRREDLRLCFEELANAIPGGTGLVGQTNKAYKCTVVLKAIDYVRELESQVSSLQNRLSHSHEQLNTVRTLKVKADRVKGDPREKS